MAGATRSRACARSAPKPHQKVMPWRHSTSDRPTAAPCCSTMSIASAHRSAVVQMPSQPSPDMQRLVHTPTPGPRVDPASEDFAPVIAPDAQPEREPAGSELGHGEDLPRHEHGMAQNHQVNGKVHAEFIGGGGD